MVEVTRDWGDKGMVPVTLGQTSLMVSHTKRHAFLAAAFHQPFRNTYGIAVWLATPIKPRWGFVLLLIIIKHAGASLRR